MKTLKLSEIPQIYFFKYFKFIRQNKDNLLIVRIEFFLAVSYNSSVRVIKDKDLSLKQKVKEIVDNIIYLFRTVIL